MTPSLLTCAPPLLSRLSSRGLARGRRVIGAGVEGLLLGGRQPALERLQGAARGQGAGVVGAQHTLVVHQHRFKQRYRPLQVTSRQALASQRTSMSRLSRLASSSPFRTWSVTYKCTSSSTYISTWRTMYIPEPPNTPMRRPHWLCSWRCCTFFLRRSARNRWYLNDPSLQEIGSAKMNVQRRTHSHIYSLPELSDPEQIRRIPRLPTP